jgi:colicin import membrane protein
MKQHLYSVREPNFQKIIITSAVIHVLFITLIAVPLKSKKREYKSYFVNIVTPAQLRKTAELETGKSATGTVKKKSVPRRREKSKKGVALEPADRAIKEIKRLTAISALANKKKQQELALAKAREAEEARTDAIDSLRKKMMANISVGPADPGNVVSAAAGSYHALIIEKIQSQWIHSSFASRDLEALISFKMDKNGKVISHKIEHSSGNYLFDLSAVKAILKASPLPPHPVEKEIEVRFHL